MFQALQMLKSIIPVISFFVSVLCIACTKADIRFGDQYLDNTNTQIVLNDTFQVALSSIHVDSFSTSASGISFVGGFNDPLMGKIRSVNYTEVALPVYIDQYQGTSFDSIELILKANQYYYGDTTQPLDIAVHRLTEPIVPFNESAVIYNTQQFQVYGTPLGQTQAFIRPLRGDTIAIRLSDQFGQELFQKMQDPTDVEITSTDGFLQYLNGLRLSSSTTHLIAGFADSIKMRIHYSKPGLYKEELYTDFVLNNSAHHFNQIQTDRRGTPLQSLNSLVNEISSSQTANQSYVQFLSGVMTKIRFPSLREILKVPNFVKILKAVLIVRPVSGTYQRADDLPASIRLAQTNLLNQIGGDVTYVNSSGDAVTQNGSFQIDLLYGRITQYSYDVTEYIKAVLAGTIIGTDGLLLLPPSPAYSNEFKRLVIGDKFHPENKTELQIYYATVK